MVIHVALRIRRLSSPDLPDASTTGPVVYIGRSACELGGVGSPYHRPYLEDPSERPWATWTPQRRLALGLVVAICVGALLRFLRLGTWSLWLDESLTLADSFHGQEVSNPLGYMLMGWIYRLSGDRPGEFMLRLPSAVLGVVSIGLTVWCFRPLAGRYATLGAGALMAWSSWHLYWSQNARFYTLTLVLTLLGSGLVLRAILYGRTPRLWLGLLLLGLAPLSHPSAAILLGALVAALWVGRWQEAFKEFPGSDGPWRVLGFAVLFGVFVSTGWAAQVLVDWEERQGVGTPLHFLLSTGYLVTPTVGLGLIAGAWVAYKRLGGPTIVPVLVCVFGGVAALVLSLFVRVSAQYVFVFLPWFCLVAALPLALLQVAENESEGVPLKPGRSIACGVYVLVLVLPGAVDSGFYLTARHGDRPRWREAYRFVFDNERGGDLVLGMDAPVGEYYLDPVGTDLRSWRRVGWLDSHRARLPERWSRYPRRTWFVIQPELLADWPNADREVFEELLREECERVAVFPIPYTPRSLGVEVWLRE